MKHSFVKVSAVSPNLKVGDIAYNVAQMIAQIEAQERGGIEILVFPALSLCGATCGDLFLQDALVESCKRSLLQVAQATKKKKMLVFVGLPVYAEGALYTCAAAVCNGEVLAFIPQTVLSQEEMRYFTPAKEQVLQVAFAEKRVPMTKNVLFCDEESKACVGCELNGDLWAEISPSSYHALNGANVIVNLSAQSEGVEKPSRRQTVLSAQSAKTACAYLYCNAGRGESTADKVFSGNRFIYENGELLAEAKPFDDGACTAEIDIKFLASARKKTERVNENYLRIPVFFSRAEEVTRVFSQTPFLPQTKEEFELILKIQSNALAQRLFSIGARTAVIGVSGGLDSTLALLVTARAFDILKKDRKQILAYTMPGFGTTKKTKNNSLDLMNALGVTSKTVDISTTVRSHFKDVAHDEDNYNATYENAQARYRTMVLMDVANEEGGIVVGTGDLSELALGWCTYNGDHMSNYAVNASLSKTLVKAVVCFEAERLGGTIGEILTSIVQTEISPELLPPDAKGNIAQKTEDLVGPYELHDFYLYHFLGRGASPAQILRLAQVAFANKYDSETLKKWLIKFYKRFFSQQFKRNCMPDGVKVGSISLSPRTDLRMPSDASANLWLKELEE